MEHWTPYAPTEACPWNLRRVVHLHCRGGFRASWDVIQRDREQGPEASLERLLSGRLHTERTPDDFEQMSAVIRDAAIGSNNPNRLKAWWLYRMLFTPDPLGERLVLMWHNHFATSNLKVGDIRLMLGQNELFREFARAPFGELLSPVVRHPATLIWLDADSNRKEHPNENLARELMELFSMGAGNYAETDVKEAARALTGWTAADGRLRFVDAFHDVGEKTILGRRGPFTGDDLVTFVLDQPATSRRLAGRICGLFFGEGVLEAGAVEELAAAMRERGLDIGWAVKTVLGSAAFFSDANIAARILGPVEFAMGAVRACELLDPPPSTLLLSEWTQRMGQDLFYPPNVFGWDEGRAWITTRSTIVRSNFALALTEGSLHGSHRQPNLLRLAGRHEPGGSVADAARFFSQLILGEDADSPWFAEHAGTATDAAAAAGSRETVDEEAVRRIVTRILSSPRAQLG